MSFKIFVLQIFRKIKSVEIIEKQRKTLRDDYLEFQQVEKSEELAEFLSLKKWVNSDEFKKRKAEINALEFQGSKEFNQLKEFKNLKKARHIKKYFIVAGSNKLKRFGELKNSEKLNKYDLLLEYMKDGEFQKEKREVVSQVFKGSVEEKRFLDYKRLSKLPGIKAFIELNDSRKLMNHEKFADSEKLKKFLQLKNAPVKDKQKRKECRVLKNDSEIKFYFRFEKSKKLKFYRETNDSHDLKKYLELKAFVESDYYKKRKAFLKDRKKFGKSEAYNKLQKFNVLKADQDVKFFLKFEKSSDYKNYLDVKDSFDLKRLRDLKEITSSKEFLERKAYLEDKKRWIKSEEFAKQQHYLEAKNIPHLVKYFKYKGTSVFDSIKNWEVVFEDDFLSHQLNSEKWSTRSYWADQLLNENYSMPGDLHVFTNNGNIKCNHKLTIEVKKEKSKGQVWKMPAGFVPMEFDYTSGMISTGNSFWQEDGIFEAKIKFNPVKQVVSSFSLLGEKESSRVNLLEMGTKNRLGISNIDSKGKVKMNGLGISNLKKGKSYIFAVEKSGKSFTWRINEKEVLKIKNTAINYPLHINASNIVVYDIPDPKLPFIFEINWVKCYRKK